MQPNPIETSASATSVVKGHGAIQRVFGTLQRMALRWGTRLETWARNAPFRFAAVVVTVLFATVIAAMPPGFQTNDDAVMCMIVSGQGLTLEPDEHMVFTNVIIGKILKSLYSSYPRVLWYGWYLVATQWVVTIAIFYCFLRPRSSVLRVLGFAVYFLTAGIYFLVNLQFTSTANLTGIAGGILLLQLLTHASTSRREQVILAVVACLLLVWGGLIRSDAFMLAVLLVIPTLAVAAWAKGLNRQAVFRVSLAFGVATGLMFFAERYHQSCYSDQEWQAFYQYNPLRIKFNDEQWVKYSLDSKPVFDQVGWSKNDCEMIIGWYFDDPIYDKEKLNAILNGYPWTFDRNFGKTLRSTLKDIWRQHTIRAIFMLLPAMLMFLDRRERRYWPCGVAALTAVCLLLAILVFRKAPPERVFMPVFAFPWLVLLHSLAPCRRTGEVHRRTLARVFQSTLAAWHFRNWTWWKPGWRQQFALRSISCLLATGVSISVTKQIRIGNAHANDQIEYEKMLADLRPEKNKDRLVMAFGGDFPYEYQTPLFGGHDYTGLHFYCIGWPQRTPFAERMKQHYNIETVGQALAEKHDMLVIVNSSAYGRIMEYLAEHYNSSLRIVNQKSYRRYDLSKIEPREISVELKSSENPELLAVPNLEFKGTRR